MLQYLLALPEPTELGSSMMEASVVSLHAMKKRKSLLLLSKVLDDDDEASPSLFNLADLLQNSVRSSNPQTVIAAFKLLAVLLDKDHPYAVGTLLRSERISHDAPQRTHGALDAELDAYISVAEQIAGEAGMDDAYEAHVKDVQLHMELHCCSSRLLTLESLGIPVPAHPQDLSILHPRAPLPTHALQQGDRLFEQMLSMLDTFLTNNTEVNLSLTQVILTLVSCPQLKLEDWIAVNPLHYHFDDPLKEPPAPTEDIISRTKLARRQPTWSPSHTPSLLQSFQSLNSQIATLKSHIPSFSQLINTRKQAFRLHDEISSAIHTQPLSPRPTSQAPPTSPPPPNSLSSRLFGASMNSPSTSRSGSPRGRTPLRRGEAAPTSSPSPMPRMILGSPVRSPVGVRQQSGPIVVGQGKEDLLNDIVEGANSEVLVRKIRFPLEEGVKSNGDGADGEVESGKDGIGEEKDVEGDEDGIVVSLSHVLTNIVILQEFILELAAMMQVRASLFGEVKFIE
jgi:hypothetical protein